MNTRTRLLILGFVVVLLVVVQASLPRAVDWTESYDRAEKAPYGTWVTASYLERHVASSVVHNDRVAWRAVRDSGFPRPKGSTWMMLTPYYSPDTAALDAVLTWVRNGGTWFLGAEWVSPNVSEALDTVRTRWNPSVDALTLVHPAFERTTARGLRFGMAHEEFMAFDTTAWTVLAVNNDDQPVLMRRRYGQGAVILSCTPLVFTNYGFINDTLTPFAVGALSYVPRSTVIWDDYVHPGAERGLTLLDLFRQNTGLRWAWYVLWITALLYVFVYARRRQRAIPILEPVVNTSAEYVRTIGRLYYARHDNRNMAQKMIRLFRDHVHRRLRLRTDQPTDVLIEQVAGASGVPTEEVAVVLRAIDDVEGNNDPITEAELLRFHQILERYHRKARP
jgi:hypothetical protein